MAVYAIVLSLVLSLCAQLQGAVAYNNGYGAKPFLGWQSWCAVGKCGTDLCTDSQVRSTAKAMVDNGMHALGFEWIVIDDCWHPSRDANGTLVPYKDYFPNGIKPVADYVHSLGLKFGLYTSIGELTCHHGWSPGSLGHYQQDVELFASWGVDYVKVDWCGTQNCTAQNHIDFGRAMNASSRQMVLELCRGPYRDSAKLPTARNWTYAPSVAQVWRAAGDHHDSWTHTLEQLAAIKGKGSWSGPFGWAYLDMMMIGGEGCEKDADPDKPKHCPLQSEHEYRTEASLYSIVSSPMMVGTDIRDMTPIMTECLLNPELIAINQDAAAPPGDQTVSGGDTAWVRNLTNGTVAVAVTNMGSKSKTVSVVFAQVAPKFANGADVRDIWQGKTVTGVQTQYSQKISSHDTLLVVLGPPTTPPGPPSPPTPPGPPSPPPPPPPGPPSKCSVVLTKQVSKTKCELSKSGAPSTRNRPAGHYGCTDGAGEMWVDGGCRGVFTCDGVENMECDSRGEARTPCKCSAAPHI